MPSSESELRWICRKNSSKIDRRIFLKRTEVSTHPLKLFYAISNSKNDDTKSKSTGSAVVCDPLGLMLDGDDPLSMFQKRAKASDVNDDDEWDHRIPANKYSGLESWFDKKSAILSQYGTTQEVLSNTSCFSLQDKEASILKGRSDRREDLEEGIIFEINDITPSEFYRRLECFHNDVVNAWKDDQRVKALKIVIQCSKLLCDSHSAAYYPNKYVYVTDILDTFGHLVFARLKSKCRQHWKPDPFVKTLKDFPDNFTVDMVPEAAKDTCRNWFYKIASIRELIPRLYVEAALLECNSFIETRNSGEILSRLRKMVRGVGDPLVNVYLRCYLCRVGVAHGGGGATFFVDNFYEFLDIYKSIFAVPANLYANFVIYLESFIPPLEWMLQGVIADDENKQFGLLELFRRTPNNTLLLYITLTSFQSSFIVLYARQILEWFRTIDQQHITWYKLLKHFARCYERSNKELVSPVPGDILDSVWNMINQVDDSVHYMTCVDVWLPLTVGCLPLKRVDEILQNLIRVFCRESATEKQYAQLENIIRNLTNYIDDFILLLMTANFLPFLNLFRNDHAKVTACKTIMESFVERSHESFVNDSVILNNLMVIAKILHDSISALTVEDEKRQIGIILSTFVRRVDFGRDFEQQLEFYVEARGAFFNLDSVHVALVHCVNRLSFETLKVMKGRHKAKTSAFVRACAAYCFITIPSIVSPLARLQLYMLSGQVALANQCLGQADAFFIAAIETIPDFPTSFDGLSDKRSEPVLRSYIKELYSILLVVPDNPQDKAILSLPKKLLNTVPKYPWHENNAARCFAFIQTLYLLNAAYQDEFPYHFLNVDSNDVLYGSDSQFRTEINALCTSILEEILKYTNILASNGLVKAEGKVVYELFFCIILKADMSRGEMAKLAAKLWGLATKCDSADKRVAIETINQCIQSSPSNSPYVSLYNKLLAKLE